MHCSPSSRGYCSSHFLKILAFLDKKKKPSTPFNCLREIFQNRIQSPFNTNVLNFPKCSGCHINNNSIQLEQAVYWILGKSLHFKELWSPKMRFLNIPPWKLKPTPLSMTILPLLLVQLESKTIDSNCHLCLLTPWGLWNVGYNNSSETHSEKNENNCIQGFF